MASSLTVIDHILPTAPLGAVNPLPAVAAMPQAPYEASTDGLPARIARGIRYGQVTSIHPYLLQDQYGRSRSEAPMRLAVLENEHLRAEFALDLGGRLIGLVDKATGRDLVYRNEMLQPANLALRNAWFSGGAEWNIGMRGHWPLTCDPLYAAALTGPDGEPVLRMWEYERVRGLIVQIDATLAADAPALHVHVRVHNPKDAEAGMYWWTNIAVAQSAGSRVFAPATTAYRTDYDGSLKAVDFTVDDASRPAAAPAAADYFFDILPSEMPWIAALDAGGAGLAHVSTVPLTGRKLFVWGDTTGGRRWCDWLGGATGEYFEIQAGLATTQYEHLPMPGGATWEWTETFLPVQVDAGFEGEWTDATAAVGAVVRGAYGELGSAGLDRLSAVADAEPGTLLSTGSPWGALEQELAAWAGEMFDGLPGVRFSRDGAEGAYWAELLDAASEVTDETDAARRATGGHAGPITDDPSNPADAQDTGPAHAPAASEITDETDAARRATGGHAGPDTDDPSIPPASYVAGASWDRLLAASAPSWQVAYHRAVIAHAAGDLDRALALYAESEAQHPTAWAARGAAQAQQARGDDAIEAFERAYGLAPDSIPLALEFGAMLLAAGRSRRLRSLLDGLSNDVAELGRFRVLAVQAALASGDRVEAGRILEAGFEVPDLREGELSMSALWHEAFPGRPVPAQYDFEMAPEA
ncbi:MULTISPECIES: DUF5107 domain-containing protein [unclassified Microbacterium]|uniref:DUF5107 domain-containing protein n=1 Tax=unclassified Microbacterium TaxID=2609290 RepID=UPI0012F79DBB|nr:DUF5107 domain-containing protein [Microbacterium sp. MAH-37]MVQ41323.1 DUF5107 domain-containing protein [Microbacterium sp. MAH-37]